MKWTFNDGGRAQAEFKAKQVSDCVTRAVAIATGKSYLEVYDAVNALGKAERKHRGQRSSARNGVFKPTTRRYLESLGWAWTPTMKIGEGCKVHLRDGELPMGRLIVQVSRHVCAVIDGVVQDTFDPSRDGNRCVYGYWRPPTGWTMPGTDRWPLKSEKPTYEELEACLRVLRDRARTLCEKLQGLPLASWTAEYIQLTEEIKRSEHCLAPIGLETTLE